jgi:hypothetical protein
MLTNTSILGVIQIICDTRRGRGVRQSVTHTFFDVGFAQLIVEKPINNGGISSTSQ